MNRKIISLFIALLMFISILTPAALAETHPWDTYTSLHGLELQRSLVREPDGDYSFTYTPLTFGAHGAMGGIQLDLDNDGADEYLQVVLSEDNYVSMLIYEQTGGEWRGNVQQELYQVYLNCNIQANDVFLKHDGSQWIIFYEEWLQENCVADGAAWSFNAWHYNGNELVELTSVWLDGTDISGSLDDWLMDTSLAEYRPELAGVAEQVLSYGFAIDHLYWASPICEQDTSVTAVSRLMSVQDISYSAVSNFSNPDSDISSLSGFRSMIVDCSLNGYRLPEAYYLGNNQASYGDDSSADATTAATEDSYYIIPDSDIRALTEEELSAYDKDTLALIRNEILARYGYPFKKQKYIDYFESQPWYQRNENFTYGMLTSLEMENIELIKKLEAE